MSFDYKKHEEMTTKQTTIIIAIIAACFVGIWLVNHFGIWKKTMFNIEQMSRAEATKLKIYLKKLKKEYFGYKELFWFNVACDLNAHIEALDLKSKSGQE